MEEVSKPQFNRIIVKELVITNLSCMPVTREANQLICKSFCIAKAMPYDENTYIIRFWLKISYPQLVLNLGDQLTNNPTNQRPFF